MNFPIHPKGEENFHMSIKNLGERILEIRGRSHARACVSDSIRRVSSLIRATHVELRAAVSASMCSLVPVGAINQIPEESLSHTRFEGNGFCLSEQHRACLGVSK